MVSATSAFYGQYAEDGAIRAEAQESAISIYFARAYNEGGKVLDIGSGSRRDLAVLRQQGFDAYGMEPNDAMRTFAAQNPALLEGDRDGDGRLFRNHSPALIGALLKALGFSGIELDSQASSVYRYTLDYFPVCVNLKS